MLESSTLGSGTFAIGSGEAIHSGTVRRGVVRSVGNEGGDTFRSSTLESASKSKLRI